MIGRELEAAPALAGRARELAAGEQVLSAVRRGRPAALELVGEAGIGKTAVAGAIAAEAERAGMRVLRTRAAAFERDVPYGLWVELLDNAVEALAPTALDGLGTARRRELGRLLPALRGSDGDDAELTLGADARFRLHRAVGALIAALAGRSPLVLALDDLHWADPAGLELLLHLLRHPPDAGVLMLLAARPSAAAEAIAEAARDLPERVALELGPLAEGDARTLLRQAGADAESDGAPADAAELLAQARGNPFFLLELARAGQRGEALPRSVQAAVESTLRDLGEQARMLLDGAALAGDPFDVELAARAGGVAPADADAALDELVSAGVVALDHGDLRCRFRHPLVRHAVHARIGVERRRGGHAALAQALQERGAAPRALAPHVAASARPGDETAIALLDAAAADAQPVAPDAAASWLASAERLLPGGPPGAPAPTAPAIPGRPAPAPPAPDPRRAGLRLRRSLALAATGRVEDAHAVLLAVHDDLPPGSPLAVPVVTQLAQVERGLGRPRDADARLRRALDGGLADGDPQAEAQLRLGLAFGHVQLQDKEAGPAVAQALAAAERARAPLAIASARACLSVVAGWEGDHVRAAAAVGQALDELTRVSDEQLMQGLETVYMLGLMAIVHERYRQADALLERGALLSRRSGQDWALAALLTFRGMSRWNLGDMAGALATVDEGIEIARLIRAHSTLAHALSLACNLRVRAGERAAGVRAGEEALRLLARQQPDVLTATSKLNAALFMALDHDPAQALRDATAAAGPELEGTDASWTCQLAEYLIDCSLAIGDRDGARRWAQRATELAAHAQLPLATAKAASARALVALADGDAEAAVREARAGLAGAEAAAGTPHTAFARAVLGRALAATDAREAALAELSSAAAELAACGLQRAHDRTAREIRRLGGRVSGRVGREAGVEGLDELSEREREIAGLVADGTPNKRIATTLHLSEKTVANHLTNIYAKLGLRGRTELAALVTRARAGG